jgi:hypothetical protein
MDLSETQKAALSTWVAEGADLGTLQSRLKKEFDLSLTYLDTRFLLDDLDLELQGEEEKEEEVAEAPAEVEPPAEATDAPQTDKAESIPPSPDDPLPSEGGSVSVTVDQITQPQAVVSGRVTFSDGESAGWYLDQMGRLGLDPTTEHYQPSEDDAAAFQMELQKVLQQKGF